MNFGTKLFDLQADPKQEHPINDLVLEAQMAALLADEMRKASAPAEQFVRLGLPERGAVTPKMILQARETDSAYQTPDCLPGVEWSQEAKNVWRAWTQIMPP